MSNIFDLFKKISAGDSSANKNTNEPISMIIAGLGNPGKEYAHSRHNAGFMCIDMFCARKNIQLNKSKFQSICGEASLGGKRILIMKPQTFMNKSGEAIRQAADFYKISPENIIIISDDVSLDVGNIRIKRKGTDGGHNGLKNIIYHIQNDTFPRIKIGVGKKPNPQYDLADWVLGSIPSELRDDFFIALSNCCDALEIMAEGNIDEAMNKYN